MNWAARKDPYLVKSDISEGSLHYHQRNTEGSFLESAQKTRKDPYLVKSDISEGSLHDHQRNTKRILFRIRAEPLPTSCSAQQVVRRVPSELFSAHSKRILSGHRPKGFNKKDPYTKFNQYKRILNGHVIILKDAYNNWPNDPYTNWSK